MKEIYSLLNEVKTDMEYYEKEDLSDMELAERKIILREKLNKKRNYKGVLRVACAAFAIILAGGILYRNEITVSAKSVMYQIGNFLGIDKNLQDYTAVLNTTQTDQGYSVTLNEVILDNDELVVATTIRGEQKITDNCIADGNVYINGKLVSWAAGGSKRQVDDYTAESLLKYQLNNIDTQKELEFEIVYDQIGFGDQGVKGKWKFVFIADGIALAADTLHIPIDSDFELPNGARIHLTEYTRNNLSEKIYFTISGIAKSNSSDYDMKLSGEDNLKNKVEFYISSIRGDESRGSFAVSSENSGISEDATSVILVPYAVKMPEESGRLSNDFQKTGDEITVDLVK